MSEVDGGVTDAAIGRATDVTRRAVGTRRAAAGDDVGGPVRLGPTELAQVKLDGRPAGAPVVAYLGPGAAPGPGAAIVVTPTTDRAPQGWQIILGAPVPVGSQSVLGVNGYVYGPYSRQEEWDGPFIGGNYLSNIPSALVPLGSVLVPSDVYAWVRATGTAHGISASDPTTGKSGIVMSLTYRVRDSANPLIGTGPLFQAATLNMSGQQAGTIMDVPKLDKDTIASGRWVRTDGINSSTPTVPWLGPGAVGYVIFDFYYQLQHYGEYGLRAYLQGSIRRGSLLGATGGPRRANAFASIPGYPP